jgi:hypothetical protein
LARLVVLVVLVVLVLVLQRGAAPDAHLCCQPALQGPG